MIIVDMRIEIRLLCKESVCAQTKRSIDGVS